MVRRGPGRPPKRRQAEESPVKKAPRKQQQQQEQPPEQPQEQPQAEPPSVHQQRADEVANQAQQQQNVDQFDDTAATPAGAATPAPVPVQEPEPAPQQQQVLRCVAVKSPRIYVYNRCCSPSRTPLANLKTLAMIPTTLRCLTWAGMHRATRRKRPERRLQWAHQRLTGTTSYYIPFTNTVCTATVDG